MAEEESYPADQTWRKSLQHPLTVADMEETDDQLREVSLTCLHGTIAKQSFLFKKNSCQWALMAQYEEGERNVRHIFTVGKKDGRIVPVRIDYLPTGKWTSKFLGIIETSTKQFAELVTVNPMNGLSYKEHKRRPDAWIKELCKSINSQLLESKLWDVDSYRDIKDVWDGSKQMIEGKTCKKCQAHRFWIFMAYKQPTTHPKKLTGRICVWTENGSTERDFAEVWALESFGSAAADESYPSRIRIRCKKCGQVTACLDMPSVLVKKVASVFQSVGEIESPLWQSTDSQD